jgi:DegV family protein with EDD domain
VALVTDSIACLPEEETRRYGIEVVPFVLVWLGEELRDGIDISPSEFWRRLATDPELPTTSTMSPGTYLRAFRKVQKWAGSVACVCIPRQMSAMYEAAQIARQQIDGALPVDVIEAGGAAMASGFPALLAARAGANGADHAEVVSAARHAAKHSELVGVLDSLEYVARSGRVPGIVARLADAIPSTFMLRFHDRRVSVRAKFGSRSRAVRGMVNQLRRAADGASYLGVAVHYCLNVREAEELAGTIERELRPQDMFLTSFTPVMGAHTGPGLVGISYCALP